MSRYQHKRKRSGKIIKLPYIKRLVKKGPNGLYRYRITKKGIDAYADYAQRIKRGVGLKRVGKSQHMETYDRSPQNKIRSATDFELLPEQILPYYVITEEGKQYLSKIEDVLYVESRVKEAVSGEA